MEPKVFQVEYEVPIRGVVKLRANSESEAKALALEELKERLRLPKEFVMVSSETTITGRYDLQDIATGKVKND